MDANLDRTNPKDVNLVRSNLKGAYLDDTHCEGTNFEGANFEDANFEYAKLLGAKNLTVDQLSKAKTLYHAKLDPDREAELRANNLGYLLDVKQED